MCPRCQSRGRRASVGTGTQRQQARKGLHRTHAQTARASVKRGECRETGRNPATGSAAASKRDAQAWTGGIGRQPSASGQPRRLAQEANLRDDRIHLARRKPRSIRLTPEQGKRSTVRSNPVFDFATQASIRMARPWQRQRSQRDGQTGNRKKGKASRKVSGSREKQTLQGQTPGTAPGWKRPGK